MVNTEIRLIIFFAPKDAEALYSQQKQDWELTVAQIMNLYCKIQTYIEESRENHYTIQLWPKSNPLQLYSGCDKYIQGIRSDRQSAWRSMGRGSLHCTGGSDQNHP